MVYKYKHTFNSILTFSLVLWFKYCTYNLKKKKKRRSEIIPIFSLTGPHVHVRRSYIFLVEGRAGGEKLKIFPHRWHFAHEQQQRKNIALGGESCFTPPTFSPSAVALYEILDVSCDARCPLYLFFFFFLTCNTKRIV